MTRQTSHQGFQSKHYLVLLPFSGGHSQETHIYLQLVNELMQNKNFVQLNTDHFNEIKGNE